MQADRIAADGTVITHAAMIVKKCDLRTSLRCLRLSWDCFAVSMAMVFSIVEFFAVTRQWASLKKPTPKIAPTAICVELTGRANQEATITVMAAERATQ